MRLLVIQFWTTNPGPLEASLRAAGIEASITRVDFEAALNAALVHERFDAAILDPSIPDLSRERVEACFRLNGRAMPIVILDDVNDVGAELLRVIGPRRN